ncbi:hypothetical protein M430DRAFT_50176 [Amorphotheca resinae ATCC 22711]|uniref:Uncharacterized protein n=1 Tax=Amorphotheca resinae ATCC 22711 TaxID=857342 RepID=A0A2T3B4E0_AMORE|nr:hypothetical protein M430DRAFT_50176 [Amorphotheca resinae ATCC 22711]PSS20515.1 hypothetical protein M430DRAFT_50176 [Amorphotheca resinae ATCC 22711]
MAARTCGPYLWRSAGLSFCCLSSASYRVVITVLLVVRANNQIDPAASANLLLRTTCCGMTRGPGSMKDGDLKGQFR